MSDVQESAQEADQQVVADEAEIETPEVVENTEGQEEDPPAEDEAVEAKAEDEKPSASKLRRERRKASKERVLKEIQEAKAEAEAAVERLARIEEKSQSSIAPKEADFDTYEEYQAALSGFHSLRMMDDRTRAEAAQAAEAQKKKLEQSETARRQELAANWQAQVAEAKAKYADFDAVVLDDAVPISPVMAEVMADSDMGAEVAYFLGTNRGEAAEIAALSPLDQARRIGAIEAKLNSASPNKTTNAPAPINPVKGKAAANTDPTKMSVDEYRAWRQSGGKF